ncbi:MAG: alternative ribosome rescue aminoacyl-tRNA hydrolase ArfB [Patescibacteria group bacterium]
MFIIPKNELKMDFARSSGPGGQNVNKTSSKVQLRWNILFSRALSPEQKWRLQNNLRNKITKEGEILISAEDERSQYANRAKALKRLNEMVSKALSAPKKRRPTRPTKAAKIKRLESKKKRSAIKKTRSLSYFRKFS